MRRFVLLGLGSPAQEGRGRTWPIPGGCVSWVAWRPLGHDEERDVYGWDAGAGRYLIEFADGLAEEEATTRAHAVADALSGLYATPQSPFELNATVLAVPDELIYDGTIDATALMAAHPPRYRDPHDRGELDDWYYSPHRAVEALQRLPVVLSDGDGLKVGLVPALVFWRLTVRDVAYGPEDIEEAFADPTDGPVGALDRAWAEQALHNAFKSIEALLGGWPPKDQTKFEDRLRERGLDPAADPLPADRTGESLVDRLVRLREVRSKHAAHAGETGVPRRFISWATLLEAYFVAWHCIYEVIEGQHMSRRAR